MVGEQLGRYEIVRTLGSGAMGEVFAAYDESLDREVALKVLRPQFAEDFERRQRFEREAKAIAALDHPNIVTIYSVEEDNGTHFLTMQLVEGRTLDDLIPEGGLALDAFLDLALRLVEAVAAAHQKGVVHRDLKPSNVMVAEDGRLKVLDFGLAKLRSDGGDVASFADPETLGLTLEGQIIGTVAYMAPEQAEGRAADHRSDIFSLGVLMYEMATGEAPFTGDTPISVMSSIIKDTPSLVSDVKSGMPPHLSRIVKTCMAKEPVRRFQSTIDLRNALDDLKSDVQSGEFDGASLDAAPVVGSDREPERTSRLPKVAAGVTLVVAALASGFLLGRVNLPAGGEAGLTVGGQPALSRLTSQAGLAGSPSWSPDGLDVVYSSDEGGSMDLWHREEEGRVQQITFGEGSETEPDWAPDDTSVAYTRDHGENGIAIIPPHVGGQPTTITTFGSRPRWSPNSSQILFQWRGDIFVVDAQAGAEPIPLVRDTAGAPRPTWSHDGLHVYYWNRSAADVYRVEIESGMREPLELVPTGQEVAGLSAARDGTFLVVSRGPYGGNKDLWKVALDDEGRPTGEPTRLTWPTTDDIDPALSPNGNRLAYSARHIVRQLWSFEIDPETGAGTGGLTQVTVAADSNYYPGVSRDGTHVVWTAHRTSSQGALFSMPLAGPFVEAKVTTHWGDGVREIGGAFTPTNDSIVFTSTFNGSYELWHASCVSGCVPTPLTSAEHPTRDVMPSISPAGDIVVFASNRSGNWDVWALPLGNGNGAQETRLTESLDYELYPILSPTGTRIAYWTNRDGGGGDIWVMNADGTSPHGVVVSDAQEGFTAWSPDERFLYFTSDRSGSFNIWGLDMASGEEFRVTQFDDVSSGLPESVILTKFAVSPTSLITPVEERSAGLWVLEGIR